MAKNYESKGALRKSIDHVRYNNSEGESIDDLTKEIKHTNQLFQSFLSFQLGEKFSTVLNDRALADRLQDVKGIGPVLSSRITGMEDESKKASRHDRLWQYGEGVAGPIAPALRSSIQLVSDVIDTVKEVKEKITEVPISKNDGGRKSEYEKAASQRDLDERLNADKRAAAHEGPPEKEDSMDSEILDELKSHGDKLDTIVDELKNDDPYKIKDISKSYEERSRNATENTMPLWNKKALRAAQQRYAKTGKPYRKASDALRDDPDGILNEVLGGAIGAGAATVGGKILSGAWRGGKNLLGRIMGSGALGVGASVLGGMIGEAPAPTPAPGAPPVVAAGRANTPQPAKAPKTPKTPKTPKAPVAPKPVGTKAADFFKDLAKNPEKFSPKNLAKAAGAKVMRGGISGMKFGAGVLGATAASMGADYVAEKLEDSGHYGAARTGSAVLKGLGTGLNTAVAASFLGVPPPFSMILGGIAGIGHGLFDYFSSTGERRGKGIPGTVEAPGVLPEGTLPVEIENMPEDTERAKAIKQQAIDKLEQIRTQVVQNTSLDRSQILAMSEGDLNRLMAFTNREVERDRTLNEPNWAPDLINSANYDKEVQRVAANPQAAKYLNYLIKSGRSPYGNKLLENIPTGHFSPRNMAAATLEMERKPLSTVVRPTRPKEDIDIGITWPDARPKVREESSYDNPKDSTSPSFVPPVEPGKEQTPAIPNKSFEGSMPLGNSRTRANLGLPIQRLELNKVTENGEERVENFTPKDYYDFVYDTIRKENLSLEETEIKTAKKLIQMGLSDNLPPDERDSIVKYAEEILKKPKVDPAQNTQKIPESEETPASKPTTSAPVIVPRKEVKVGELGAVSSKYESGGNPGAISSGHGDLGGKSYGLFQFASKTASLGAFLKDSGYWKEFKGMRPGSAAFDAKWKELAENDPNFAAAQREQIKKTHYDPMMKGLADIGMDMAGRGKAVQEAIFSTATQYGPGSMDSDAGGVSVFKEAFKGKNVNEMSDEEIIQQLYDYKKSSVNSRFRSSSSAVRSSVSKRFDLERRDLLSMVDPAITNAMNQSLAVNEGAVDNQRIQHDIATNIANVTNNQFLKEVLSRPMQAVPPVIVGQSNPAASTPIRAREPSPYDRYQDRMMAVVS